MTNLIDRALMFNMSRPSIEEYQAQPQTSSKNARCQVMFPLGNGGFGDGNLQNPKQEPLPEDSATVSLPVLPYKNPSPTYPPFSHVLGPGKKMIFNNNEMINPWGDRMMMPGLPGRRESRQRSSRELRDLLDKREYESDRLKRAKEREENLKREEENIDKEKLFKLKSEVSKLEEKRKQQEWQTFRRHERLMRKREEISRAETYRGRARRSRSKSLSAKKSRRSKSRTRAPSTKNRSVRNKTRRSRSGTRFSFRRESFHSNTRRVSPSPKPRISIDQDRRYVRYRNSASVSKSRSPRVERGKSKSRIPQTRQVRRDSRSPRKSTTDSRDRFEPSAREREGRSRHRAATRARSRVRSRSPGSRFRYQ